MRGVRIQCVTHSFLDELLSSHLFSHSPRGHLLLKSSKGGTVTSCLPLLFGSLVNTQLAWQTGDPEYLGQGSTHLQACCVAWKYQDFCCRMVAERGDGFLRNGWQGGGRGWCADLVNATFSAALLESRTVRRGRERRWGRAEEGELCLGFLVQHSLEDVNGDENGEEDVGEEAKKAEKDRGRRRHLSRDNSGCIVMKGDDNKLRTKG